MGVMSPIGQGGMWSQDQAALAASLRKDLACLGQTKSMRYAEYLLVPRCHKLISNSPAAISHREIL